MRTIITLGDKRISKKAACERYGKDEINKRIKFAKETFFRDPLELSSWWMGDEMLSITFE